MISFYVIDVMKVVIALFLAIGQLSAKPASAHAAMLNLGDEIDGMTLTWGAEDAPPLWAFCTFEVYRTVTTSSCRVPQLSKLAIGFVFPATEHAFGGMEWSEMQWELYLDDEYVDLGDFGTYDYLLPVMAPKPVPARVVFMKLTAWDVVLTNLQPGAHTLEGSVRAGAEEYRWVVDLVIEEATQAKDHEPSEFRSECPGTELLYPPHHGPCRLIV